MPIYKDIVEYYQLAVESGELAPEDVPGPKAIAAEWGCSHSPARRARMILRDSGLATRLSDVLPLGRITDEDWARFLEKVDPPDENECTLWNASLGNRGYGQFFLNSRMVGPHRVAYEYRYGSIPSGLVVDHVFARGCRSQLCVNSAHLEAVTQSVNMRRGWAAIRWMAGIQVVTELDTD